MTFNQNTMNTVFTGTDIRNSRNDVLQPMDMSSFLRLISNAHEELQSITERLRKVRDLNMAAYQGLKCNLPYFLMASFNQNLRHGEGFQAIHGFCLDIDGIAPVGSLEHIELKTKLADDTHALAVFTTPSGCGLKVICLLEEPCTDAPTFSAFYKNFAAAFADRYGLKGKLDMKTADVTRVHFYCSDANMLRNTAYEPVRMSSWGHAAEPGPVTLTGSDTRQADTGSVVDYDAILARLGGQPRHKPAKNYFVPDELYAAEPEMRKALTMAGIEVKEMRPIQYGLKFIGQHQGNEGEVNVFAGKKGFSVVRSPRNGTHSGLNNLMHALLCKALFVDAPLVEVNLAQIHYN